VGVVKRRTILPGLVAAVLVLCTGAVRGDERPRADDERPARLDMLFPRPAELGGKIRFWTKIFTVYSADDIVFHDAKHVNKIYSVLNLESASQKRIKAAVGAEKKRLRALLLRLHDLGPTPDGLSESERKVFELFRDVKEEDKFRAAAGSGRIRAQTGLRERFKEGIRISRRYLPEMERIFAAEGLPVELTRLPLIESTFDIKAYSHAGAAGIWQFMPRTGRVHGLRVDRLIDERRDPILSTYAAARYLANAYRTLGSWPLAITAYNHGPKGIARAMRRVGSDNLVDLIQRYEGRYFGFAGRNFYGEFLVALDIDRRPERYFGAMVFAEPVPVDEVHLPASLGFRVAATAAGVSPETLAALNPALGSRIVKGGAYVPRAYRLRLPAGKAAAFKGQVSALAGRRGTGRSYATTHRVRRGQTLSHIAARYGTTVSELRRYNGIRNPNRVRVGQRLKIPDGGGAQVATAVRSRSGTPTVHRVRRGQTLSHIAARYGTTVSELRRHNGIRNPNRVRVGQRLKIPGGSGAQAATAVRSRSGTPTVHRMRRGQTLSHVAKRYRTTVSALMRHNGIRNPNRVRVGQRIRIPGRGTNHKGVRSGGSGYVMHRVRRGQTLSHIAKRYGTSVTAIKRHNRIKNPDNVRVGQMIKVPTS
jgi:membrane-bound lytic murein transglycosylase D